MKLQDKDPFDYAKVERKIPASKELKVSFDLSAGQNDKGILQIDFLDENSIACSRLELTPDGIFRMKGGSRFANMMNYEAGKTYHVEAVLSTADRKIFQPHPQSDHHHGGAGGPAGGMAAVGVFLPHHRPRVGQRRLAAAQSAYDAVPRAQGREQRLQDRLDRAHGGAAAAGRGTVPLLWQQAPGQAAAQQAAGGGRGPQG